MCDISTAQIDRAIAMGATYNVTPAAVRRILSEAGLKVPNRVVRATIEIECEIPVGRAVYPSNLEITEANGMKVKVIRGSNLGIE